mmetsp:Transcript_115806/g.368191  ORF Transcript_115806/g.368191 Transcript_115806/m.368191 type:complete len:168 (+) Transcript_115806:84-587(+)
MMQAQRTMAPRKRLPVARLLLLAGAVAVALLLFVEVSVPQKTAHWVRFAKVSDNSGASQVKLIMKRERQRSDTNKNGRNFQPGDIITCVAQLEKGKENRKVMRCVILTSPNTQEHPTHNGFVTQHAQTVVAMINDKGDPIGKEIYGPVDPKCLLRWPKIQDLLKKQK